ncbi:MAG: hypothetical protein WBG37_10190 [Desulfobacterales bacterium]|jgi:hypothetical protein
MGKNFQHFNWRHWDYLCPKGFKSDADNDAIDQQNQLVGIKALTSPETSRITGPSPGRFQCSWALRGSVLFSLNKSDVRTIPQSHE